MRNNRVSDSDDTASSAPIAPKLKRANGLSGFDAVFHFGGVNLFNDPDRALREFVRVVKKDGVVSWGDEGFSKSYKGEVRKRILAKLNPGFLKPVPGIPETLHAQKVHEVYGGLGYLIVARKN